MSFLFSHVISVLSSPLFIPPYVMQPKIHVVIKYHCLFLDCLTSKYGSIQCWKMSGITHPVTCNNLEARKSYQRLLSITHHISTFLSPSTLIIYTVVSLCSRYATTTRMKLIYILSPISSTLNELQTLASLIFCFKFFHTYFHFFPHIIRVYAAYKLLKSSHPAKVHQFVYFLPLFWLQFCRHFVTLPNVIMPRPSLTSLFFSLTIFQDGYKL